MSASEKMKKKLKHLVYSKKLSPQRVCENYDSLFTDKVLPNKVDMQVRSLSTNETFVFKPIVTQAKRCVLYFHGGFFYFGSQKNYSTFCSSLSNVCQTEVFLPKISHSYNERFPFQLEQATASYKALTETLDHKDSSIVLAGDGTGAALCLALALNLKAKNEKLPVGLALMSPFLDFSLKKQKSRDSLLSYDLLQFYALSYASAENLENPQVSPLRAEPEMFRNFPPVFIQAGRDEFLFEQSTRLQEILRSVDSICTLESLSNTWHLFQAFPDYCDTACLAMESFGLHIRKLFEPIE